MIKKIIEMDVSTSTTIRVPRNIGVEEYLIRNAAPVIRNRRLLSLPIRNIPFGVRGRRRVRRQSILYIGMRPNLDNVQIQSPAPIQPTTPNEPSARSTAPRVYRRLVFSPSPARNVITSPPTDHHIDLTFTDAFGRLSIYNDSD